jgi:hypothetical protein
MSNPLGSRKGMSPWKSRVVVTLALLSLSFTAFLITGYTALYWACPRADLPAALPFLPSARSFGMLAMACPAVALESCSRRIFPIAPRTRLSLSLLATVTIGFFSEFRNGYLTSPHSSDEVDLPFEFAGTMVGFWMARTLTKPFDKTAEEFRSTFLIDFVSSGVMGLLYTFIIGSLTESVAGSIGHALYPVVPGSLDMHEYTPLQQHMRPLELFLLAGAMSWVLN